MSESIKDKAESIRHRLRNLLRARGEDVQFGLQRYAIERFLYRLGVSSQRERFVLKGAALFALWGGPIYRPTRDLDFTGYGSTEEANVVAALREICLLSNPADELVFDPKTLYAEPIRDDSEYSGLRIRLEAMLGASRIPIQIDIGFGNAIEPPPQYAEYPTLLDDPPPRIRAYPAEAVIAEKLHAMVVLGERNSRYKDFYDLHVLSGQFGFDGERLTRAIAATFARRRTPIDAALPTALTPRFFADAARAAQWRAYRERNNLPGAPADFDSVGELIRGFLGPVWSGLAEKASFTANWRPGGSWNSEAMQNLTAGSAPASARPQEQKLSDNADTVGVEDIEIPIATPLRRFKPYPAYKDSGVEWLGEIPAHWNVVPLKRLGELQAGAGFPEDEQGVTDEVLPFFKVGDMAESGDSKHLISAPNTVSLDTAKRLRAFVFAERTIVFAKVGAALLLNRRRILTRSSCIDNNMMGFSPYNKYELEWAFYWLAGLDFGELANPGAVPSINEGQVRETPAAVPLLEEQRAIANFLDGETAKIDALVAKKERLIELLQEKRAALITRAVTKGLPSTGSGQATPNVPMKDSGVEWLGEIRAHWYAAKMWRISTAFSGGTPTKDEAGYWGGDIPWVSPKDMKRRFIESSEDMITQDAVNETGIQLISPPVVLIVVRGMILAHSFPVAVTTVPVTINQDMKALRFRHNIKPVFMAWVLEGIGRGVVAHVVEDAAHGTKAIRMDQWRSVTVPIPPEPEQRAITAFLERETAKIDALVAKIRQGIEKLKEYRTALISAAVTGKIDVREEISSRMADSAECNAAISE